MLLIDDLLRFLKEFAILFSTYSTNLLIYFPKLILCSAQHGFRNKKTLSDSSWNYIMLQMYIMNALVRYRLCGRWLNSYLSDGEIQLDISEILSNRSDSTLGVPQGSIFRPLLFLIFVNDLRSIDNLGNNLRK